MELPYTRSLVVPAFWLVGYVTKAPIDLLTNYVLQPLRIFITTDNVSQNATYRGLIFLRNQQPSNYYIDAPPVSGAARS